MVNGGSVGQLRGVPSGPFTRLKSNWRAILRDAIKRDGRSLRGVSIAAGLNGTAISEWYRDNEKHKPKNPSFDSLAAVAAALGISLDMLAESDSEDTLGSLTAAPIRKVKVAGFIQAGIWQEPEMIDVDLDAEVPFIPHRLYSNLTQYAWRVRGPSLNRIAQDGDFIIGVKLIDIGKNPENNAPVVCERHRGETYEYTVKRIQYTPTGIMLIPDSTDPRFQDPVWMSSEGEGDEEVLATHLVIGVFRQL